MITDILEHYPTATDIHVTEGEKVSVRVAGELVLTPFEGTVDFLEALLGTDEKAQKEYERKHILDVGRTEGGHRLRLHFYQAGGKRALALRVLPEIEHLPVDPDEAFLSHLATLSSGLVLISGTAGSGKSTTLAHIVTKINETRPCHVITLEDPVEYLFPKGKACIHQRAVGRDTRGFSAAVTEALREDPDVIVIGEMRDCATMEAALTAAETGHLVFVTLHNRKVKEAIGRIVHAFPAEEQGEVRRILSYVLQAVMAQRLWRKGNRSLLFREILINSPAVGHLIEEGAEHQLSSYMESGSGPMRTFRQAVYQNPDITEEERKDILALLGYDQ